MPKAIPIQLVTWNVNRRRADVLDALKHLAKPDILTLQEVTFRWRKDFQDRLADMGLKWCCPDSQRHTRGKDYGSLIASCWKTDPVEPRYLREKPAWHELLVQASMSVNGRTFLVINVHIPNGSKYGWKKIDTFKALNEVVRQAKGKPCIVTGDFNEPKLIPLQDGGRIVTWGQWWDADEGGYVSTGKWKQWDAAVRWIFEKHDEHQMRHAYWDHERGGMPVSHVTHGVPRWFDHLFVSPHFRVKQCEYLHSVRLEHISDHSALSARLMLDAQG